MSELLRQMSVDRSEGADALALTLTGAHACIICACTVCVGHRTITLSWGTSPTVTAVPAPRDGLTQTPPSPLAHLSIAGEVCLSPCGGAAPSGRCCDPETMADGRWPYIVRIY